MLEVEKLLKDGFIYPVSLTDWVSNLVSIDKKQGTICVCVDYRDINKACPKDNFPTPFIDQIVDNMQHILTRQFLGEKYSKWIVILQEFDLEFEHTKSKKSLVFVELICDLPCYETENVAADSLPYESLFLISSDDLWYGDIIIYL